MITRYLIKVTHNNGGGVYYVGKDNIIVGSYGVVEGILLNKKVTEKSVYDFGYKRAGAAKNNLIFSAGCVATARTSVEVVEVTLEQQKSGLKTALIDTIAIKEKDGVL